MYMKSTREDQPQDIIRNNPFMKLSQWSEAIKRLTEEFGQDMVLYGAAEGCDCVMYLSISQEMENAIEQNRLETNPEITLKQWKEALFYLIEKHGANTYLYAHSENRSVEFFVSPIAR